MASREAYLSAVFIVSGFAETGTIKEETKLTKIR